MAEETKSSQSVEKAATPAPVEPNIDVLLPSIPDLKDLFSDKPPESAPEQPKEGATTTEPVAPETPQARESLEDLIPEGLRPQDEAKPAPEEPKKEEFSDKVQKRIDELTAKRKTAEERASLLESELNELKSKFQAPPPISPSAANPLADIETEADLAKRATHVQEARQWCLEHWDGGEISDNGNTRWIDGPTVRSIYGNADKILSRDIPDRSVFLKNRDLFNAEAKRQYPAIFKEGTEANATFKQWLTVFPECRRYPDIALIVGDALVGQGIRLGRAKAANGSKLPPQSQIPLASPAPAASPRVPQSRALSGEALRAAFDANPEAALDNFVDGLIQGGSSGRAQK